MRAILCLISCSRRHILKRRPPSRLVWKKRWDSLRPFSASKGPEPELKKPMMPLRLLMALGEPPAVHCSPHTDAPVSTCLQGQGRQLCLAASDSCTALQHCVLVQLSCAGLLHEHDIAITPWTLGALHAPDLQAEEPAHV